MNITIDAIAENALLLTWPEIISTEQHQQILSTQQQIKALFTEHIIESICAYNSLIIYYHFQQLPTANFIEKLQQCLAKQTDITPLAKNVVNKRVIEIPVYYGEDAGWDLLTVAKQTHLAINDVIALHSQQTYRAYALGFTPGFCYLATINEKLLLPRKATPRLKVPAGAVAIAQTQTAVYPTISPGGWHILGQTPHPMFKLLGEKFEPTINVGDEIKFTAIDKTTFEKLGGIIELENTRAATTRPAKSTNNTKINTAINNDISPISPFNVTILKANTQPTVQDLGRFNYQHLGFSASGVADEFAFLSGNQILGNNANDAALEVIFGQLSLTVNCPCDIAITGADCYATINNKKVAHWQLLHLNSGDILQLNMPKQGIYSYLCFAGGLLTPALLGSQSTLPTTLQKQLKTKANEFTDILPLSTNTISNNTFLNEEKRQQALTYYLQQNEQNSTNHVIQAAQAIQKIRFIPHALWWLFTAAEQKIFLKQTYQITANSNKMGYRLNGKQAIELALTTSQILSKQTLSKPVTLGTIQIPNDGQPIILMKDRQTIGGYPTLGTVIQVDIPRLAQMKAPQTIQLIPISLEKAQLQYTAFYQKLTVKNTAMIK